jgi:NAD(P)-dependent dehydrogenase (short-subunit alcohol dehydrogenase family)
MHTTRTFDLSGKVMVITGGAGLIGREFAAALAGAGARVILADIDLASAEQAAAEVDVTGGGTVTAVPLDVTDPRSVKAMVEGVVKEEGRLDALINNAAINPQPDTNPDVAHGNAFEHLSLEEWKRALSVDLTGAFLCAQAAGAQMLRQGGGIIINIGSTYGMVAPDQSIYEKTDGAGGYIKPATYTVTKSALLGLTRYLAAYWAGKGIRVNTLTLGGIYNAQDEEFVKRYSRRTPLGRMADRSEVRGAIVFLTSDEASYMTGANVVLDGGWTAW